ncbi:hypothetical protein LIER_33812 [Lithospermum erythrorhizon]|uniref:Uncharacterized protein n=1 Tax=Lithospermum erythrorhizon TaxID=34254 RepID=A0AAV3RZZ4_LITER
MPPTEVLPVQPLAVRNPETAQLNPSSTPSSTPAPPHVHRADASQTGASAGNTGDLPPAVPTVVRDSLPVPFSSEDLENVRQYFSVPHSVEMRLPVEGDMVFEPRVDPSQTECPFSTDEVLNAAQRCVEPKDIPFSTMAGERRPLFRKTKVRRVPTSSDAPRKENFPTTTTTVATSNSNAEKRPAPEEGRPKLFAPRKKHVVQQPKRVEHVTISEDPLSASSPPPSQC